MPDQSIALSVTRADGSVVRWGPDELNPENVPTGLTWESSIPGGDKTLSCALLRDYRADHPDQALFDDVRAYGAGNETRWNGRMSGFPAQLDTAQLITPTAVGWSSHLLDDPSFREIYVDRDMSRWRGPSVQRRLNLVGANFQGFDPVLMPDQTTGQPSLSTGTEAAPWAAGSQPSCEALYDGNGVTIGSVYYAWKRNTASVDAGPSSWAWAVYLMDDDVFSSFQSTGDLQAAGPGTGTITASTSTRDWSCAQLNWGGGAAGTAGLRHEIFWTCLAVYGNHGLTKRGAEDATNAKGFYVSDMIADVVRRAAPKLTFTSGPGGSIEPSTFIVPHATYVDPTTASDVVTDLNKYHLYEWGVYGDREFFWRQPDPSRLTWRARIDQGARISLEGEDVASVYNGVIVLFTDPSGQRRIVGPPGTTGANSTSTGLQDTSADNPVNAHNIARRWAKLEISSPCTDAAAIQIGTVFLAERGQASRRGSLTLTGTVGHPTKGERPVSEVRAGDYIMLADRPDDPARRIINVRYDHDRLQATCDLDNTVFRADAILERMGINLVGVL
jgi:hypothetical protein